MSKFKVGDKVVWSDKNYAMKFHKETINSVMTITEIDDVYHVYEGHTPLVTMDNGVEALDFRFQLYKQKEVQEFDKRNLTTGMRVVHENGEVGIVLKDIGVIVYKDGFNLISDFDAYDFEIWKLNKVYRGYEAHAKVLDHSCLGELIWERKEETEQQKRIRELKETIDNASKQLKELMKETK